MRDDISPIVGEGSAPSTLSGWAIAFGAARAKLVTETLCLAIYISVWVVLGRVADLGLISRETAVIIRPAFEPLMQYCESGETEGRLLAALYWTINPVGGWRPVGPIIPSVGPLSPSPSQVRYRQYGKEPPDANGDLFHPKVRRAEYERLMRSRN